MRAVWWTVIGAALAGCTSTDGGEPIDSPEATLDAADAIEAEATFMFSIVQGTEAPPTDDAELLAAIAAKVPVRWMPAGCAQVSHPDSTSLAFTFEECSGPRGLVGVTGTLELRLLGWAERPVLAISSPGMAANGSTFEARGSDVSSEIYPDSLGVSGGVYGTAIGPRGHQLERAGSYDMTWNSSSGCPTLRATTQSRIPEDPPQWLTTADVTRCPGRCPTGVVTRRFPNGATVKVDMDGTTSARWTSMGTQTETRSGVFDLPCE